MSPVPPKILEIQSILYEEVTFGTNNKWPYKTDVLLNQVQFIWHFLWQDKKEMTIWYRWLLNRGDRMSRFYWIWKKTKSDTHKNKIDEINTKVHPCLDIYFFIHIQQIVHGTEGHMAVYGPVYILPYDPKWHELFAILYFLSKIMQVPGRSLYYRSIYENSERLR